MKVTKKDAIRAYKVFNADWTCRGFQYQVGKMYVHKGDVSVCESGFHACKKLADCFEFYEYSEKKVRVAEVTIWGTVLEENNKLCADHIVIERELQWSEVQNLCNSGYCNSGNCNSGNRNSGNWNSGNWNSGDWNSGDWNSGDWNSGDWNSGYCNSGNCNSGNRNYGNCNSGDWNSGDRNSGDWNSGDRNSGYFNTPDQKQFFCFNKLTEKQKIDFPAFLYFESIEWINISVMTAEEKNAHPECDVIGGYLKTKEYKQAFRESFEKAKKQSDWNDEYKKLKAIPNFNYAIFEEISGISKEDLEK